MRGITAVVVCALAACGGGDDGDGGDDVAGRCPAYAYADSELPDMSAGQYCCGLDVDLEASPDQDGCTAAWIDEFSGQLRTARAGTLRVVLDLENGRRGVQGASFLDGDGVGPLAPTAIACQFARCIE